MAAIVETAPNDDLLNTGHGLRADDSDPEAVRKIGLESLAAALNASRLRPK